MLPITTKRVKDGMGKLQDVTRSLDSSIEMLERLTSLHCVTSEYGISIAAVEACGSGVLECISDCDISDLPIIPLKDSRMDAFLDATKKAIKKIWEMICEFFRKIGSIIKSIFLAVKKSLTNKADGVQKRRDILVNMKIDESAFIESTKNVYPVDEFLAFLEKSSQTVGMFTSDAHITINEALDAITDLTRTSPVTKLVFWGPMKTKSIAILDTFTRKLAGIDLVKYYGIRVYYDKTAEMYYCDNIPNMMIKRENRSMKSISINSKVDLINLCDKHVAQRRLVETSADQFNDLVAIYGKSEKSISAAMKSIDNIEGDVLKDRTEFIKEYRRLVNITTSILKAHLTAHDAILTDLIVITDSAIKYRINS